MAVATDKANEKSTFLCNRKDSLDGYEDQHESEDKSFFDFDFLFWGNRRLREKVGKTVLINVSFVALVS